jgi:hypothetical protein
MSALTRKRAHSDEDEDEEIIRIQDGVQRAVGGPIPIRVPVPQRSPTRRKKRSDLNSPEYDEQNRKAQDLKDDFDRKMAILEGNNLMIAASNERLVRETQDLRTKNYQLRQQIIRMNGKLNDKDREIAMARESRDIESYRKMELLNNQIEWLKETLSSSGYMPMSHIDTALQHIADGSMHLDESLGSEGGLSDVGPNDYKPNHGTIKW